MYIRFTFFSFILLATLWGCTEDDDTQIGQTFPFSNEKFISKIHPDAEGFWFITRTIDNKSCAYCSSIDFIDGITYFSDQKAAVKDALGYFLDSEPSNGYLLVLTGNEILKYNQNIESSVVKKTSNNESFKLLDKDERGKVWVLSNKSVSSLNGDVLPFKNNISAIDFEASRDSSFWIASSDTVYHLSQSRLVKYCLSDITGKSNNSTTIYSLKTTGNDSIWVNTSEKIYKYGNNRWREVKTGGFVADNFKTLPFMDIDATGKLWLAEKNYQAFTNILSFDGSTWNSYKLDPPFETWITDIEPGEAGTVWIGTASGLHKLKIE